MNFVQQNERQDMILEPLQVMIQLSLVSHCPLGTKVSISNNILHIQKPTISQGMVRWWYGDNKDDLYYLFHAIRRFYLWYKTDGNNPKNAYILKSAIKGIDSLINTYKNTKLATITTTLQMYKNILDLENQELFKTDDAAVNIDNVFEKITDVYEKRTLVVVYNILNILDNETNDTNIEFYYDSLQAFLQPTNLKIQQWIRDNLTC